MLANRCITLARSRLVATRVGSTTPLLLEADEDAGGPVEASVRVDSGLPDADELLDLLRRGLQFDRDA